MGIVTKRTTHTARGFIGLSPWDGDKNPYGVSAINLGNNSISRIEIVSSLNSLNIAYHLYQYNAQNCPAKYNPKVHLGTIQSVSQIWQSDSSAHAQKLADGYEKSGSWPILVEILS